MIYAAFTVWLFLSIFIAMGVYSLWTRLVPRVYVTWALLPGTIVSEMAYIFGCLITGGEIRRAKLMPGGEGKGGGSDVGTEANPRLRTIGPIVAAMICIVACAASILAAYRTLGAPVIWQFEYAVKMPAKPSAKDADYLAAPRNENRGNRIALPAELPTTTEAFWDQMDMQVRLLRRMCWTWGSLEWLNWRVALFVYLAACLSVRMAPAGRPFRATLAAAIVVAAVIALVGAISDQFTNLVRDLWPLLTYVYTNLLFLLAATLLLHGLLALIRSLAGGKKTGKQSSPAGK